MNAAARKLVVPSAEVRLGRWQDVLVDVDHCDSVITDPPYSARVIKGQRSGAVGNYQNVGKVVASIPYPACTRDDINELFKSWAPRVGRWFIMFGDHVMMRWLEDATIGAGKWMFWHRVWLKSDGGTPRFSGDGPDEDIEHIAICRPRKKFVARHRGGSFSTPRLFSSPFAGAKPVALMRAIVRAYSEPGDLVVDPYAGSGSTLIAARMEGRRAIGAEMDAGRHSIAQRRVDDPYTPNLFGPDDGAPCT